MVRARTSRELSSIKTKELIRLKNYLDRQNIKFYERPANLQGNEIFKNIRKNLADFYEQGGWQFLSLDAEGEQESEEEDNEEDKDGDVEFRPESDAEFDTDESSEDYSDSDASGALDELGGDSDAGEESLHYL